MFSTTGFGSYDATNGTAIAAALAAVGLVSPNEDIGKYIFSLNPYKAVYPPPNTWALNPPAIVKWVAAGAQHDYLFSLNPSGIEHHERPGEWKFKESDHYVHRALRIPYMYYKKSDLDDTEGVLVRDYFLIGFEGGMGY